MTTTLSDIFTHLNVAKYRGQKAPHKAVLMLAVIDLIEEGAIDSPFVYLTDELIKKFNTVWKYYVGDSPLFKPDICKPFYHLRHESFWRLIGRNKADDDIPYDTVNYTVKYLRDTYVCAVLDSWLLDSLQNQNNRDVLRTILIGTYLTIRPKPEDLMA